MVRVDPGLLRERLKPPVQKDQPLADKLVVIPILLLILGGMGFMAADAARWRWSIMPPSVQWAGCGLLLAALLVHILDHAHEQLRGARRKNTKRTRPGGSLRRAPMPSVRHPMYFGALFYIAGTSLVLGSWWGLATGPPIPSPSCSSYGSVSRKRRCARVSTDMTVMPAVCAGA